jgi:hypothetical protein
MIRKKVRRILIPVGICAVLLGALFVLTANLDDVTLAPGQPSRESPSGDGSQDVGERGRSTLDIGFVRHLLFVAFTASLAIVLLGALFTRFLRRWLYFAIGLFGALLVFDLFASKLPLATDLGHDDAPREQAVADSAEPGSSEWLRVLTAVGLSLGTGVALALGSSWIAARWHAYRIRREDKKLTWELEWLAERALSNGRNTDLVLRCYHEMVDLLSRKEHIAHASLTAREFAGRLRELGLRTDAIDRLTRLFELVRYGHRDSGPFLESAVASLEEVRGTQPPQAWTAG